MIYFTADYSDREELLSLGATFDFARWQWRVESYADYKKFARFLKGKIITRGKIRFLQADFNCPFCGKPASAYAMCIGAYTENFSSQLYGAGEINILYGFEKLSGELAELVAEKFGIKKVFSPVDGYKYLSNSCKHCEKPFVDWYFFDEPDSPFFLDTPEKAAKLKVYAYEPTGDTCLDGTVKWSFPESVIKDCGEAIIKR